MATPAINLLQLQRAVTRARNQLGELEAQERLIVNPDDETLLAITRRTEELLTELAERETALADAKELIALRARQEAQQSSPMRAELESLRTSVRLTRRSTVINFPFDLASDDDDTEAVSFSRPEEAHPSNVRAPAGASNPISHHTPVGRDHAARLSHVILPTLEDPHELSTHFTDVEKLLCEEGFGCFDASGEYVPPSGKLFSVGLKFAQTLRVEHMKRAAEDLVRCDNDWSRLKREMNQRFSSTVRRADEFHRRAVKLSWKGANECASLIDEARGIWRIGKTMASHQALKRDLVQAICRVVPTDILYRVLESLNAAEIPDWEMTVDFDSDHSGSFCESLSRAARSADLLARAKAPTVGDKLKMASTLRDEAGPTVVPKADNLNAIVPSIRQVEYYRLLTATYGKGITPETVRAVETLLEPIPYKPYVSKRGGKGLIIACRSDTEFESVKKTLSNMDAVACRDFIEGSQRPTRNSPPPPTKDKCSRVIGTQMEYYVRGYIEALDATHSRKPVALEPMPLLEIDSGAGLNYLIPSASLRKCLQSRLVPVDERFGVAMANGAQQIVSHKLVTSVTLYAADQECLPVMSRIVDLHILDNQGSEQTQVLLGRDSIHRFDLVISKRGVATEAGAQLMEIVPDEPISLRETSCFATGPLTDTVTSVLKAVEQRNWVPLLRSDGYKLRLRPLTSDEPLDHPDQTHVFEVDVPSDIQKQDQSDLVVKNVESEARGMVRKLDSSRREKQKDLVQGYVDSGWWTKATVDECREQSRFSPVVVFLVGGGVGSSRKPRLVVNFKPVNEKLPSSSTPSTAPAQLLAAFRYQHPSSVIVSDAASAFYKLRLNGDKLWLVVCIEEHGVLHTIHCLSDRVVFGIVFGPSSLITSMTELFQDKGALTPALTAFSGWYMDDNIIAGAANDVCDSLCTTIALLRRTGHDLQLQKCAAICTPELRPTFEERLSRIGEVPVTPTARILGVDIDFDDDRALRIRCSTESRRAALVQLNVPDDESLKLRFTKAEFFSIAGALSYDVVKEHTAEKFLADAIRSLIGREFAGKGWHEKLDLRSLSDKKQECWKILIGWSRELAIAPQCCHVSTGHDKKLCLYSDASSAGGGFCISAGGSQLWADTWRWCAAETRWHINYQELQAIFLALRALTDIVERMMQCLPKQATRLNVCVFSDNRSAVKWSMTQSTELLSKHQSRRSLTRLVDKISDEWKVLKQHANVSIEHLPGLLNVRADELSRYGLRKLTPTSPNTLQDLLECERKKASPPCTGPEPTLLEAINLELLDDYLDDDPLDSNGPETDDAEEEIWTEGSRSIYSTGGSVLRVIDSVRSLRAENESPPPSVGWAELAARDCYDMVNLEESVDLLRNCLRGWFAQRKKEGRKDEVLTAKKDKFEECIARSAQSGMSRDRLPKAMRSDVGPLFQANGIWYYKAPLPTGAYVAWPFIPHAKQALQSLIIRTAHRQCAHMGLDYTLARVQDFVLHNPRTYANEIIRNCLFCQRKNAERSFKQSFESVHDRGHLGPYESMAIDHLSLGDGFDVLVVLCLATGHTTVSACRDKTATETANALKRVLYRYSVRPRFLLSDKAANISAAIDNLKREFGAFSFDQTTARSQFENGKLERINGIILPIAVSKLHFHHLTVKSLDVLARQDFCDYISWQINQRPLGTYVSDPDTLALPVVLTPNVLMFGNCCDIVANPPKLPIQNKWKQVFDEFHWRELKKRSDLAVRGTFHPFHVKEPVLVFKPTSKCALSWHLGHVVDIQNKRLLVRDVNGKENWMHEYNVCPLRSFKPDNSLDVSRKGADCTTIVDGITYSGVVTRESDGRLLVSWNPRDGKTWPPEWCLPDELELGSA